MVFPSPPLLLSVPTAASCTARRYNPELSIQIPKASLLLVEFLQFEALAFSSHASLLHLIWARHPDSELHHATEPDDANTLLKKAVIQAPAQRLLLGIFLPRTATGAEDSHRDTTVTTDKLLSVSLWG